MPKKSFYAGATLPTKKVAGTAPTAGPRLGTQVPTSVPKKPGRTTGLVQPLKLKPPRHKRKH